MFEEIDRLHKLKKSGIALDIDETLSWTLGWWVERMQELFGNPEELTKEDLIKKYRYTQNVPYWQTEEAISWMNIHREDDTVQLELPLIEGADIAVQKLNKVVPVVAYITARPDTVRNGTLRWLEKHKFPKAALITRPKYVDHSCGNEWKADVLAHLYPKILGIVDDNPSLVDFMPGNYKGTIFLYDYSINDKHNLNVIPCANWDEVLENAKIKFGH